MIEQSMVQYSKYCYGMACSQEQTQTFSVYYNDCFLNLDSLIYITKTSKYKYLRARCGLKQHL